jgi:hypothetical protein
LVDDNTGAEIQHAVVHCTSFVLDGGISFSDRSIIQTATALGKLGHPDGELNLTRAAAKHGVIQMVCISDLFIPLDCRSHTRYRFQRLRHVPLMKSWTLQCPAKPSSSSFMSTKIEKSQSA